MLREHCFKFELLLFSTAKSYFRWLRKLCAAAVYLLSVREGGGRERKNGKGIEEESETEKKQYREIEIKEGKWEEKEKDCV